jgi:hypothetical protein
VQWSKDVGAADWIVERLLPFGSEAVGGFLPDVFEAYARVLHPWGAGQYLGKIRWSDLALEAGVGLGPTTQREELESCAGRRGAGPPRQGTLESDELDALLDVLTPFTATPQSCRFGIWEGYGWVQGYPALRPIIDVAYPTEGSRPPRQVVPKPPPAAPAGPRVEIPGRSLALYEGPIGAAVAFVRFPTLQSPNLWWPDDRAWCVASEIDFCSTYVGGSPALIERILGDERLEAIPVRLEDRGIRD